MNETCGPSLLPSPLSSFCQTMARVASQLPAGPSSASSLILKSPEILVTSIGAVASNYQALSGLLKVRAGGEESKGGGEEAGGGGEE